MGKDQKTFLLNQRKKGLEDAGNAEEKIRKLDDKWDDPDRYIKIITLI